jgi:hypothetical protein
VEEVLKKCPSSLGGKEENKLPKYEVLRGWKEYWRKFLPTSIGGKEEGMKGVMEKISMWNHTYNYK